MVARKPPEPYRSPRHHLGARLRIHRDHAGLTAGELAQLVNAAESTICGIERGEITPGPALTEALDDVLGTRHELAMYRPWMQATGDAPAPTEPPRPDVPLGESPTDPEDPVRRRRMLQDTAALAVGAAVAPTLVALTEAWQAAEPPLPGASVSRAMIDDWERAARGHANRLRLEPPGTVLAALAVDFTDMAPHLRRSQTDDVRRDLARAATLHACLIADAWISIGSRREAHRWWATTHELAGRTGDRQLESWVLSWEAIRRRGCVEDDPNEVVILAQRARRVAGRRPSVALIGAVTAEAQALAVAGRATEAVTALRGAEDLYDKLPNAAIAEWGEERLRFDQSFVYSLAGDEPRAVEAQDAAGHLYRRDTYPSIQIQLHRALLHTRTDPAEGTRQAARIIDVLPPARRVTRVLSAARSVLDAVPERALALGPAKELRELLPHQS